MSIVAVTKTQVALLAVPLRAPWIYTAAAQNKFAAV
jgi:hypothetical protein